MKYLLAMMSGLEISDGIFTDYLVGRGLVREANSLMESIINRGDFLSLKIIGALVCVGVLWYLYKRYPRISLAVTSSIVFFYTAVMVWNTSVFLGS